MPLALTWLNPSMLALGRSWSWPSQAAASAAAGTATLTYLEINGWLLTTAGVTVLIDPVLEGGLDFGIPDVYSARKRVLPANGLVNTLPPLDALLITQGLDDHAHARTLECIARVDPQLPVIAPPSARPVLERRFRDVRYLTSNERRIDLPYLGLDTLPIIRLSPGSGCARATIEPRADGRGSSPSSGHGLVVQATSGALVGPPWATRENGYVLRPVEPSSAPSLYLEPHVEFDETELTRCAPVDVVITPISGQGLPGFELVHGPSESIALCRTLKPRYIVPMGNGEVDATGLSAPLIREIGSRDEFRRALQAHGSMRAEVVDVVPGVPLSVTL